MCILTQDTDHFLIFNELFLPASIICGKDINNNALYTQQFYTPEQHETIKTNKINKTVSIILKLNSKPKRPLFIRLMRKIGIYHKYLITK